jgi:hypothetical protein
MKLKTILRPFQFLQRFFPVWALRRQANILSHRYEADLRRTKNRDDRERIEFDQYVDLSDFEETIQTIQSKRLMVKARELFIYVPDLKWEQGQWGGRYLSEESMSKLYHAVKAQKDSTREYRLKVAGALTGIIGALIGLIAIWRK